MILLFPAFYRRRAYEILSECESTLVSWMSATLIDMGLIAVVSFIIPYKQKRWLTVERIAHSSD